MSRPMTNQLLDYIHEGFYDKEDLLEQLIYWLGEDDIAHFIRTNELFPDDPEEEEEDV